MRRQATETACPFGQVRQSRSPPFSQNVQVRLAIVYSGGSPLPLLPAFWLLHKPEGPRQGSDQKVEAVRACE